MKWLCSMILILFMFNLTSTTANDKKAEEGWLWYKEKPEEVKNENKAPQVDTKPKAITAQEKVEAIKKDFEETLAVALLSPSLENVTNAKNKQLELEERSREFSDMWVLSHVLDSKGYSHQGNPHPWHQQLLQQEKKSEIARKLKTLSKHYGLFFAFKQSCPYCHEFAPVVEKFSKEYGFEVKGISADGGVVEGIENISRDNGALSILNPDGIYPALFLANPRTMEVIPIAWGMVTKEQLLNNIEAVIQQMEAGS